MAIPIGQSMAGPRASDVARHSQLCYILRTKAAGAPMYICLCNGLTDRDVRANCESGRSVAMVYRSLGCEPQCGKCVPYVRQMLRQQDDTSVEVGGDD
jgi:bacterioferritin-associated ferredoxin